MVRDTSLQRTQEVNSSTAKMNGKKLLLVVISYERSVFQSDFFICFFFDRLYGNQCESPAVFPIGADCGAGLRTVSPTVVSGNALMPSVETYFDVIARFDVVYVRLFAQSVCRPFAVAVVDLRL